jgi:hypothetical protein
MKDCYYFGESQGLREHQIISEDTGYYWYS